MRRLGSLLLLLVAGCSTRPVADVLDYCCPPHMPPPNTPSFGGVGAPQPVAVPGVVVPAVPPAPPQPVPPAGAERPVPAVGP